MNQLEKEKIWTGDGFGASEYVLLTQLKRTETVALYERKSQKGTVFGGYELFIIKMRHKGDPLPGGMFEKEDREVYPSAGSFGKTAWHIWDRTVAEKRYAELVQKGIDDTAVGEDGELISAKKKELVIPVGEFTVTKFAEANSVNYVTAFQFVKAALGEKKIKFLREEHLHAKGKPSKIYEKA